MKDYQYSLEIMEQELNNKYISPEIKYAFEASIESLKKQISKEPEYGTEGEIDWYCTCGNYLSRLKAKYIKYCPNCGQKLKW
jgi:hypothetical protein